MQTKKCITCGKRKGVNKFYKAAENRDGFTNQCRDCRNEARRASYYKQVTGKLDVLKEVKAPKISKEKANEEVEFMNALNKAVEIGNKMEYRFNHFNKVKLQRNISIILNILIGAVLIYILK